MRIALGSDHAGFELCESIAKHLSSNYEIKGYGAQSTNPYDYPDAADGVVGAILNSEADYGILICGTGIGVSIRANRYPQIRAALCCTPQMAELARQHNHANVLCLGARVINPEAAKKVVAAFLTTEEDHAERHENRVEKLGIRVPGEFHK